MKMISNTGNNPWERLRNSSQKRIKSLNFNIFWAKTFNGQYAYLIKFSQHTKIPKVNLDQIKLLDEVYNDEYQFLLVLNDKSNWETFKKFCDDLTEISVIAETEQKFVELISERLKQWKKLFKSENNKVMSLEEQMGLFTELKSLETIFFKKYGEKSIINWRGAEKDVQDFLFENSAVEIKSTISSKGHVITISSLDQLESHKSNLFLIVYSLTISTNKQVGENISDIVEKLRDLIEDDKIDNEFCDKLFKVGYNIVEKEYTRFIIDNIEYYKIEGEFPRLKIEYIDSRIKEIKYKIDLSYCSEYSTTANKLEENL